AAGSASQARAQAAHGRTGAARSRDLGGGAGYCAAPRTGTMGFERTAVVAALCIACTRAPAGRKLASGVARGLIARDGAVAFLLDAAHPDEPGVPDDLVAGDLWLDDRKIGSGVSSVDGAYSFSPDGSELAFLAAWNFRRGEGELRVARRDAAPRRVARAARASAWPSK